MSTLQRDAPSASLVVLHSGCYHRPTRYLRPRPPRRRGRSPSDARRTDNTTAGLLLVLLGGRYLHSPSSAKKRRRVSTRVSRLATRRTVVSCIHSRAEGCTAVPFFPPLPAPLFSFFRPLLFLHPVFIPLSSSNPNALSISSFSSLSLLSPSLPPLLLSRFLLFRIRGGYRVVTNLLHELHDVIKDLVMCLTNAGENHVVYAYLLFSLNLHLKNRE